MSIPMMLAVGPLVGLVIGKWLDSWLGISHWCSVLAVLVGFAAGVNETIQIIKRIQQDQKNGH